jgi:hypothetical protein
MVEDASAIGSWNPDEGSLRTGPPTSGLAILDGSQETLGSIAEAEAALGLEEAPRSQANLIAEIRARARAAGRRGRR